MKMCWKFSTHIVAGQCWLPVFLCVLAFVVNGAAIKCYVCDSSDNPSCANLKSNSTIKSEECTLAKTKSINTWLFDLNKFAYFVEGSNNSPLMNCQKVVTKDPSNNKMVTARFCQLDTGNSDACAILRTKLGLPPAPTEGDKKDKKQQQQQGEEDFHCSICKQDNCNGSARLSLTLTGSALLTLVGITFLMQKRQQQQLLCW